MNVTLHALAGGAVAHAAAQLSNVRDREPEVGLLVGSALAGVASHGLLDWLRHGYPIPSAVDVVLAFALSATWLALVRPRLRRRPTRRLLALCDRIRGRVLARRPGSSAGLAPRLLAGANTALPLARSRMVRLTLPRREHSRGQLPQFAGVWSKPALLRCHELGVGGLGAGCVYERGQI